MNVVRCSFIVGLCLYLAVATTRGQDSTLADDAVQNAIDAGRDKPKDWRVVTLQEGSRGPNVAAYTPLAWIQREAAQRKREGRNMRLTDVTAEMRESVLRVVAYPDVPGGPLTAAQAKTATSVVGIAIVNKARTQALQPKGVESFDLPMATPNGARIVLKGLWAKFDLPASSRFAASKPGASLHECADGSGACVRICSTR
jgi:hypothetical protein